MNRNWGKIYIRQLGAHTLTFFIFFSILFHKRSMMNTAGSPTWPMGILAAATSPISWAPLLPLAALRALSWSKGQGQLSVSTPAILTGTTVSLCAEVTKKSFHSI